MLRNVFVTLIITGLSITANAQDIQPINKIKEHSNHIKLHAAKARAQKPYFSNSLEQFGIAFEKQIKNNWHAGVSYNQWFSLFSFNGAATGADFSKNTAHGFNGEYFTSYDSRMNYKMVDAYIYYRVNLYNYRHFFNAGAGIFVSWGTDNYTTYTQDHFGFREYYTAEKNVTNYGFALPMLAYDFMFLHDHLNVGVDFRVRDYFFEEFRQIDMGIHLGANF